MTDKFIKIPSGDTVKVNGNSAKIGEITADKKQAVITYTFTVTGQREDVKGQEIVNTESNISPVASKMPTSLESAVMSAMLAKADPDTPFAEAPEELRDSIPFTLTAPIEGQKHNGAVTTYTPELEKYYDNAAIADWARTSLGFMNALGLVKGISDTEISPNGTCTIEQAVVVANRSVNADQIGWYQYPLSIETPPHVGTDNDSYYFYAPTYHAPTQTLYYNSTRIWVDVPYSGSQKASENADNTITPQYLSTHDPYTGIRAYVYGRYFRPIKDLKDTDAAEYDQYYNN